MKTSFPHYVRLPTAILVLCATLASPLSSRADEAQPALWNSVVTVDINWGKTLQISKTTPTLQIVVNPKLKQGSPVRERAYNIVRDLQADYVRFVPWFPYPQLAVAELAAPTAAGTSWKFDLIDPYVLDFLKATQGRKPVIDFGTIPQWMFRTEAPVAYPADPDEPSFAYSQGTELIDPTGQQLGDYFGRLVSWYSKGGFTDEQGKRHSSGHHYAIPFWEVLNEPDLEHATSPKEYALRYDAIVEGIRKVSPNTQFVGLSLANPAENVEMIHHFLDPGNHKPGIPLDWISYHFYAIPATGETINEWQYSLFHQAQGFADQVKIVDSIRRRASPATRTMVNEVGVILRSDFLEIRSGKAGEAKIPKEYWNLSGGVFAYVFMELSKIGIDVVGESQLVGYPTQFPSVSMVDWNNGEANARVHVLRLLRENFGMGESIVANNGRPSQDNPVSYQGYRAGGMRKILLINKRLAAVDVLLPADAVGGSIKSVDSGSGSKELAGSRLASATVRLAPFAVAVVSYREAAHVAAGL